jgi:hypothetical protein
MAEDFPDISSDKPGNHGPKEKRGSIKKYNKGEWLKKWLIPTGGIAAVTGATGRKRNIPQDKFSL